MSAKNEIYCPLRNEWVVALPEEVVRVRLIMYMIEHLGFPPSLMVVEKCLHQLPDSTASHENQRRMDLLCYYKDNEELKPLLVVECKAVPLTDKAIQQVVGYNHFLKAPFICIVNQSDLRLGWVQDDQYCFVDELPSYNELLKDLSSHAPCEAPEAGSEPQETT